MKKSQIKTFRPSDEKKAAPSMGSVVVMAIADGLLAHSLIASLRRLYRANQAGDHNTHALLWELRRAYAFARKNPGVAASLVFVLYTEFMPYMAGRMGDKRPEPGEAFPLQPAPCGVWHGAHEACTQECEDETERRRQEADE